MQKIKNLNNYIKDMNMVIKDKLFFVDMIDFDEIDTIVEFGCGNAELLKSIYNIFPSKRYIGIDASSEMIKKARKNFHDGIYIVSDRLPDIKSQNCILILSSVLHELYTYSYEYAKNDFWKSILLQNYKYIIIRDMFSPILSIDKDIENIILQSPFNELANKYLSNCKIGSSLSESPCYMQFFLKYKYTDNWDKEMEENYFSIDESDITSLNYQTIYNESFYIPFIQKSIKDDFGLEISIPTHKKIILKNIA